MTSMVAGEETKSDSTPYATIFSVIVGIFVCAIYANLSLAVTQPADYAYFPPFEPYFDGNYNHHLGAEYFNIARALIDGRGYSDPFDGAPTGPTAWQPPVYPFFLAGLLWLFNGDREGVMLAVVVVQTLVLSGTGLLVVALARRTCKRIGARTAAAVFAIGVVLHFSLFFQWTHDLWLVMGAIDILVAVLVWLCPLSSWFSSTAWGIFGGACTMINPAVGLIWGASVGITAMRERQRGNVSIAAVVALLVLSPWIYRNYATFGRFIPLKSNVAYELYQTQCLQKGGLLRGPTFELHPYHPKTAERKEYDRLGEIGFLDEKMRQFKETAQTEPIDFAKRMGERFVGATLWYEPFWPREWKRPWLVWVNRVVYPLPCLAAVLLLAVTRNQPGAGIRWLGVGIYALYLLPYVLVSYYERYEAPLLGIKVLLILWAGDWLLGLRTWAPKRQSTSGKTPTATATPGNGGADLGAHLVTQVDSPKVCQALDHFLS